MKLTKVINPLTAAPDCAHCTAGPRSIEFDAKGHEVWRCGGCARVYCTVENHTWVGKALGPTPERVRISKTAGLRFVP